MPQPLPDATSPELDRSATKIEAVGESRESSPAIDPWVPLFNFGPWLWATLGVLLAGLLSVTGVGLMFFYQPGAHAAALSLRELQETTRFGFLQDLHYWAAQGLLIAAWLHLARVFVVGSYRRTLGWRVTVLLVTTLTIMGWTGNQLASSTGAAALSPLAVYVLHSLLLPLVAAGLLTFWARFRGSKKDQEL